MVRFDLTVVEKFVGVGEANGGWDGDGADARDAADAADAGDSGAGFEPRKTLCVGMWVHVAIE